MSKNKIVDLHPNLDNLHAYINSVIKVYGFVDNVNELGRETLGMPIIHYALRDKTISRTSSKIMSVVNTLAEFGDLDTPYKRDTPISYAIKDKNAIGVAALVLGEYQDRYVVPELSTDYLVLALTEGNDDIVKIIYKGMVRRGQDVLFNKDEIDPFMVPTMSREIWDMIYMNMKKRIKNIDEYPEQIQAYFKDAEDRRRKIIEQNQGRIRDINTVLVMEDVRIDDDDDDEDYVPSDEEDSDEYYTDEEEDDGAELEDNDEKQWLHKYVVKGSDRDDDERLEYLYKTRIGSDEVPDENFEYGRIGPGVYSVDKWAIDIIMILWTSNREWTISPFSYLEPLSSVAGIYPLLNRDTMIYEDRPVTVPYAELDGRYHTSLFNYRELSDFLGLSFKDNLVLITRYLVYNRDIDPFPRSVLYMLFRKEIDGFDEIYEDACRYCQDIYKLTMGETIEGDMVGGKGGVPLETIKDYVRSPRIYDSKERRAPIVTDHFERDMYRSIKCVYDLNIGKYPNITYNDIEEILVMNEPEQFKPFFSKFTDFDESFELVKEVLDGCKKDGGCDGGDDEHDLMNGDTMTFEHLCQAVMNESMNDASIGYKVHLALKNGANKDAKIKIIYPYKHNINIDGKYINYENVFGRKMNQ